MTHTEIIDDLTYVSYRTNRDAVTSITPERWKKVYGPDVDELEARYQAEKAIAMARQS